MHLMPGLSEHDSLWTRRTSESGFRASFGECSAYPSLTVTMPTNREIFDVLRLLHILAVHDLPLSHDVDDIGDTNVATHIEQDSAFESLKIASWLGRVDIVK